MRISDWSSDVCSSDLDIFANTGQGGVFVNHTSHLDFGGCVTSHGGQQNAAQRIAQRVTIAALERLHHDFGVILAYRFDFDRTGLQKTLDRKSTRLNSSH